MTGTALPIFPQTIKNSVGTVTNASGTNVVDCVSGAIDGTCIESWLITSTDSVARDFQIIFAILGSPRLITTITIPANAGNTNAIAPIDVLKSVALPGLTRSSNGIPYIYSTNNTRLQISALVTITAGAKVVSIIQAKDY